MLLARAFACVPARILKIMEKYERFMSVADAGGRGSTSWVEVGISF